MENIKFQLTLFAKTTNDHKANIDVLSTALEQSTSRVTSKKIRGHLTTAQTNLNQNILDTSNNIRDLIIDYLFSLEPQKVSGILPDTMYEDVKWCYSTLSDLGRLCSRYVKLPKSWVLLGFLAGVLEDLVVVMRTASQLKISPNHLITLDELTTNIGNCIKIDEGEIRFPFLDKLFNQDKAIIISLLKSAIDSQGQARRIAIYQENLTTYYYAIQGLLGGVKFDSRVVKTLTTDTCPSFAVHFTTSDVASNIWNQTDTTAKRKRPNGQPLVTGAICKFDRPIHALTNIEFVDGYYRIVTFDKDVKDRMCHGIKDTNVRPKYESGLVIDLKKLVNYLPEGMVQMNELGTLLVHCDIPHEYLLRLLHTDDDIKHFWHL